MSGLFQEIRINEQFTQLTEAVYDKTLKDESVPKIRKQLRSTPDYLQKVSRRFSQSSNLLPPNCRYIERLGRGGHIVVTEEPPVLRTIKVEWSGISGEWERLSREGKIKEWGIDPKVYGPGSPYPHHFTLAFPYILFMMAFDEYNSLLSGQVYLRASRLSGLADYLLKAPLLNINDSQYICYGRRTEISTRSLDAAVADNILHFWSSVFNGDYTYNYYAYKDTPYVNSYIGWQYYSQLDPMFIYKTDWISTGETLGNSINKFKHDHKLTSTSSIGYQELSKIFVQPRLSDKKEKVKGALKSKSVNLYYDIAQGMFLNNEFYVHVGDPLTLNNGSKAYIDSFIGFSGTDAISYIQFLTESGKTFKIKISEKASKNLTKIFKKDRFSSKGTLANGVEIKEGDVLIMDAKSGSTSSTVYKPVKYIRKSRDGITEARLGNDFYILENTEGRIFDVGEPEYQGLKLDKESEYIMLTSSSRVPLHRGYKVTFSGLTVDSGGNLVFSFIDQTQKRISPITIKCNSSGKPVSTSYKLFKANDLKPLDPIFRVGRSLLYVSREENSSKIETGNAWGTNEGYIINYRYKERKPSIDMIVKECLVDDGTKFKIGSYDLDIEFSIGDKVVVADWLTPINTLIVRTIQGFKVDREQGTIEFVMSDKNNNITSTVYVSTRNGSTIFAGRIRKITNKFGRVTAGTKIVAKEGFISNFPKKDVNIIIGFITDTGGDDPLVLCSNGCTLWFSQMQEKFKKTTMKSKAWKNMPHVPIDVQKIKFQPGDIIMCKGDYSVEAGWLLWTSGGTGMYKMTNNTNITSYPDFYHLDGYLTSISYFDCIPNPRLPKRVMTSGIIKSFPNFHGLFTACSLVDFNFANDERSILYVSDPHK